jgi:hypothetical protein
MTYYEAYPPRQPARATSLATFQQMGVSIQYPAGITVNVRGIFQEIATINDGIVVWTWNKDSTGLSVGWINLTFFNTSNINMTQFLLAGFESMNQLGNFSLVDQGNITMAGRIWEYQTYVTIRNGYNLFTSAAACQYIDSYRLYSIYFSDTYPDTLTSLEYYGNTFIG